MARKNCEFEQPPNFFLTSLIAKTEDKINWKMTQLLALTLRNFYFQNNVSLHSSNFFFFPVFPLSQKHFFLSFWNLDAEQIFTSPLRILPHSAISAMYYVGRRKTFKISTSSLWALGLLKCDKRSDHLSWISWFPSRPAILSLDVCNWTFSGVSK